MSQFPVYSWDTLIPILGNSSTPPPTLPLSAPPALSPPLEEFISNADEDDDVFESDPIEQEDIPDDMVSDTNNNSNNANNNGGASGKRRTQSLSALQSLEISKEPQSPLNKVRQWNLNCSEYFCDLVYNTIRRGFRFEIE